MRLGRWQRAYYIGAVLTGLICWSPFKALAYILPFLVVTLLVLMEREDKRLLKRVFVWAYLWLGMVSVYGLVNSEFQFGNAFVSFVTWAGFVVVIIIPTDKIGSLSLRHKLERFAWKLLFFESAWGIVQGVYGYVQHGTFDLGNGDYVEGTIHPSLDPGLAYSNVMFAISIALLLLFLLPALWYKRSTRNIVVYSLGTLAFVMASVVHAILFLIVAGGISALLVWGVRPRLSEVTAVAITLGSLFVMTRVFLPINLVVAPGVALQVVRGEVPKSVSVLTAFTDMPRDYPYLPIIGLGPGQYSSRAALVSTGLYFGGLKSPRTYSVLPNQLTEAQKKYLLPLWIWHDSNRYWGSTQKPYFSWLSVYTEFGVVGWGVVVLISLRLARSFLSIPEVLGLEKFVLLTALWFVFLLGFQENNWEVPQAWFSGLLLMKVLYASARHSLQPHFVRQGGGNGAFCT